MLQISFGIIVRSQPVNAIGEPTGMLTSLNCQQVKNMGSTFSQEITPAQKSPL